MLSANLNQIIHFFLFQILPYVSISILITASLLRGLLVPYSWKTQSSELISQRYMKIASNLFHVGVLLLFGGHCVGLLTPASWLSDIGLTPPVHQMVEIIMGGIATVLVMVGIFLFSKRRLIDFRVRAITRASDWFVLSLLSLVVTFGIACIVDAILYDRSGAIILLLGEWARSLLSFHPEAWKIMLNVPIWQKIHITVGLIILMSIPFTRLMHIWAGVSLPWYLIRSTQVMRANNGESAP